MTTKGLTRHDWRGDAIRELPEGIARLEAAGRPVIVTWPVDKPMPEHTQRLYATLGVLVRFTTA